MSQAGPAAPRALGLVLGLLLFRIACLPLTQLWRDWAAVLLVYAALRLLRPAWDRGTLLTTFASYLFAIYLVGQGPHLLAVWGRAP